VNQFFDFCLSADEVQQLLQTTRQDTEPPMRAYHCKIARRAEQVRDVRAPDAPGRKELLVFEIPTAEIEDSESLFGK
jgi:hypothetical protein